jgi:hypothetical protein
MYLVELKPGKEELYRTGDDLALAIRDGDVDARSRIYHRATAKWISITLHPQYKAIVADHAEETEARPRKWGILPSSLTGIPVELTSSEGAPAAAIRHRWKRPTGFGLAGLLLLLGIQLAFSGPRPPWAGQGRAAAVASQHKQPVQRTRQAQRTPKQAPIPRENTELVSLASTTGSWVAPVPSVDTSIVTVAAAEIRPNLPRAPRLRSKALRAALAPDASVPGIEANSAQAVLSRYAAAIDEARTRLESGMRVARLQRLFAPARLTPGGGVTDTRLSLAGAANFIRVYRQQQAAIDRAYQDSVTVIAKQHGWSRKQVKQWYSRPQLKESPSLELLSGALLSGIDSILGVLDAHAGAYKVRGTAIAFEEPGATQAYGRLRRQIREQIDAAVAAGGAMSFGPTGLLLQAIGTTTLPRET